MTSVRHWWISLRAFSFTATIIPVGLAAALAAVSLAPQTQIAARGDWWTLIPFTVAALLFHAGTNVLNDYYDFTKGVDKPGDPDPTHVLTRGLVSPEFMLRSGRLYFVIGSLIGATIALLRGPFYLAIAFAGVAGAYFYTGIRFSLKYRALGDLAVFVFMGPALVTLGFWAVVGAVEPNAIIASLPVAILVTAILHGNNLRDIETDRSAGIDTLAIRIGFAWSVRFFVALVLLPAVVVLVLVVTRVVPYLSLVSLTSVPLSIGLARRVGNAENGSELIDLPVQAAKLHVVFGALYSAGVGVSLLF